MFSIELELSLFVCGIIAIKFCTPSTFGASTGATGFAAKSDSEFMLKRYAIVFAAKKFSD